jgi:Flp pilus assembly protein TadD
MSNLGRMLQIDGDNRAAEAAYRQADEAGSGDGSVRLGFQLFNRGDNDGARAAFTRGVERGHPRAAEYLATMEAALQERS